ncbi:MAG: hypothetical protein M1379_00700 [Firmicutes bacterium]|nr:hypothetical protein [Bacillota bacterium]
MKMGWAVSLLLVVLAAVASLSGFTGWGVVLVLVAAAVSVALLRKDGGIKK